MKKVRAVSCFPDLKPEVEMVLDRYGITSGGILTYSGTTMKVEKPSQRGTIYGMLKPKKLAMEYGNSGHFIVSLPVNSLALLTADSSGHGLHASGTPNKIFKMFLSFIVHQTFLPGCAGKMMSYLELLLRMLKVAISQ